MRAMTLILVLVPALAGPPALAQPASLFGGSAGAVPANPFASNYPSPPVAAAPAIERRRGRAYRAPRRPGAAAVRPPRTVAR